MAHICRTEIKEGICSTMYKLYVDNEVHTIVITKMRFDNKTRETIAKGLLSYIDNLRVFDELTHKDNENEEE